MKNLFIVVEGYNDKEPKNANAIVVHSIVSELSKRHCNISIITSIHPNSGKYRTIKTRGEYGNIYFIEAYDNNEWKSKATKYFDRSFWNNQRNPIILSFSNPIQFSLFSAEISKRYGVDFHQYYLDPHSMSQAVSRKLTFFIFRYLRDYKIHKYANKVYVTKELYAYKPYKYFFRRFMNRVIDLGLPIPDLTSENVSTIKTKDEQINISYFGRFYSKIRNPEPVIEYLCNLGEKYSINIYGQTEQEYLEYTEEGIIYDNLKFNGYIERNMVREKINEADFLVNIGNSVTNQLPSKVLEYVSVGKPIINFYTVENDTSKRFLNKYPLAFNINLNDDLILQTKALQLFIENSLAHSDHFDPQIIYSDITLKNISNVIYNPDFDS